MPSLRDIADEQYRQKLAREYSHIPADQFNNPVGDFITDRVGGLGRSIATLGDPESWNQAGSNLQDISKNLDPSQFVGMGMMRANPNQIAGLIDDAEKAMLRYELSKIPKKPAVSLRDLAIGGGALGTGGLGGYYGIGALTE